MVLEKIISLSNEKTKFRLLAMIRSLRDTGSNLPVWVIPYDDRLFELPENCFWWEDKEMTGWLRSHNAPNTMRKYQCLLTSSYQFVDSDVIFLKDPASVLAFRDGFITSCGHWHNPQQTYTTESISILREKSTIWQSKVFNTGQFACDVSLYSFDSLKKTAESEDNRSTCINFKFHEQPGLNLLVNISSISIQNLTLPPTEMQSTWAGDYPADYKHFWTIAKEQPYLIHWAGCDMSLDRPINSLFYNYLSTQELKEWKEQSNREQKNESSRFKKLKAYLRTIYKATFPKEMSNSAY